MKLAELKSILEEVNDINFELENGTRVPQHFHLTEIGLINKRFIDCGGTERNEETISFQLWTSIDFDHRLKVEKLRSIISLAEDKLNLSDREIEIEYQSNTISKYGLAFNDSKFILLNKETDCLAKSSCGVPEAEELVRATDSAKTANACVPGGNCC